ncbi:MAG: DUF1513 domain-containing protein [Gammaproteobacteria bacterium]|nr:DUF1513 domain-containing protein [Gammaproteobacteria bacterium]
MLTSRRALLGMMAGGLSWSLLPLSLRADAGRRLYLSARATEQGEFRVSGFTPSGEPLFDLPLPARGHSFALHPGGRDVVHFARRPGSFARVIDLERGAVVGDIVPREDRRFYGHGVFDAAGRLLYATENDFEGERGVVGVYDAQDSYRRVGELSSHGAGPHDIKMLSDGETLVVANGGILTHPDFPRIKLNVPTMKPSLVYLNRRDGRLRKKVRLAPALHQLSIRHIAVGRGDTVAFAMQYVGPAGNLVPLVGTHRGDREPQLLAGPEYVLRGMKQYCGSTVFDVSRRVFAVSSPRGNVYTFWDAGTGNQLSHATVPDGSGIAPGTGPGLFLASSGGGGVVVVDARSGKSRPIASAFLDGGRWDNHMINAEA